MDLQDRAMMIASLCAAISCSDQGVIIKPRPSDIVVPSSVVFGTVRVADQSVVAFTVKNGGDETLNVLGIELAGDDALVFGWAGQMTPFSLAPNDSKSLEVKFAPDRVSTFQAELIINSSDTGDDSQRRVRLSGEGIKNEPHDGGIIYTYLDGGVRFVDGGVEYIDGGVRVIDGGEVARAIDGGVVVTYVDTGVPQSPLLGVRIDPPAPFVVAGERAVLTAIAQFADGTTQDVTAVATWNSSTSSIATVCDTPACAGVLEGVAFGFAHISAEFRGLTRSTRVTVAAQLAVVPGFAAWSATNGVWEHGTPMGTWPVPSCVGGGTCAATVLDDLYPRTNSAFESPPIPIPVVSDAERVALRFSHIYSYVFTGGSLTCPGFARDSGHLYLRNRSGPQATWTTSMTGAGDFHGGASVWTDVRVDLVPSEWSGRELQIAFAHNTSCSQCRCGSVSWGWYVDSPELVRYPR